MTTSSIADRLALLNALRAASGKAPLASWKASSAELDQRILDATPAQNLVQPQAPTPVATPDMQAIAAAIDAGKLPVTKVPTGATSKKPTKDLDKKAAKKAAKVTRAVDKAIGKKAPKAAKVTRAVKGPGRAMPKSGNKFGAFLKAQGLDPKQARATLRRKGFSSPYALTAELKAALKVDARKK